MFKKNNVYYLIGCAAPNVLCPVQLTFKLGKQGHVVFTCIREYSNHQDTVSPALFGKCDRKVLSK